MAKELEIKSEKAIKKAFIKYAKAWKMIPVSATILLKKMEIKNNNLIWHTGALSIEYAFCVAGNNHLNFTPTK
jgi:hypothetical protein